MLCIIDLFKHFLFKYYFVKVYFNFVNIIFFLSYFFFYRQLVKNKVHTRCKCYGVSGSCTTRTCWRQLASFNHISEVLKAKYENAVRVNNYDGEQVNSIGDHLPVRLTELMYVEKSPSFCRRGRYSAGVSGRVCLKGDNCKVMCCGRGYNVQNINVKTHCFCEVIWCCYVNCKVCNDIQEVHTCK